MRRTLAGLICAAPMLASAQDAQLHGFADGRLVTAPGETSWTDGGYGKTRFGAGGTNLELGGAALEGRWQALPSLAAFADVQFHSDDRNTLELVEGYARWRPVSTSRWRESVKVGAFFPDVSLENDGVGWTSRWTLTPSAINSWVGEELRTIGAEARVERRGDAATVELAGALFEASDPAGELLAARGWSLSDLTLGLGARTREPDAYAQALLGYSTPRRYDPFQEIDHRAGWTGELTVRSASDGRLTLLRYDNGADPEQHANGAEPVYAWHTTFWSLGGQTQAGPFTLVAQGMTGETAVEPSGYYIETKFGSGFLLAGWEWTCLRLALRADAFSTHTEPAGALSEHGNALTGAVSWRTWDWMRVTLEALRVDSTRSDRMLAGGDPRTIDGQLQLGVRLLF